MVIRAGPGLPIGSVSVRNHYQGGRDRVPVDGQLARPRDRALPLHRHDGPPRLLQRGCALRSWQEDPGEGPQVRRPRIRVIRTFSLQSCLNVLALFVVQTQVHSDRGRLSPPEKCPAHASPHPAPDPQHSDHPRVRVCGEQHHRDNASSCQISALHLPGDSP